MSYILDALKKSELARQQDRALDIMTVPAAIAVSSRQARRSRLRATLAAGGVVILLAALAWWRPWQAPDHPQAAPVDAQPLQSSQPSPVAQAATAMPVDPAPVHAGQPASAPREPADRGMPAVPAQHAASVEAPIATPTAPMPARGPVRAMGGQEPLSVSIGRPSSPPMPRSAAVAPAPPDRVMTANELPDSIRRALPALRVAGFSHGDAPGARLAVINDRIRREGEGLGDGVILEQVNNDGIVLSFRGYRFRP